MRTLPGLVVAAALLAGVAPRAFAQFQTPVASTTPAPGVSTAAGISTSTFYGAPLAPDRGPWVLGDVRVIGATTLNEYFLLEKVRARRGSLYMPEDVTGDVKSLQETGSFASVVSGVYAIPDQPVPAGYSTIAVSTSMVRLVFQVTEKGGAPGVGVSSGAARPPQPQAPYPVSGMVMTPTAYRGLGRFNEPGLGLDIVALYYIGRLYGKNSYNYTNAKTNYLDRVGVWYLGADGKLQLQGETSLRPAVAVGGQGFFTFRDGPKPSVNALPGVTVNVTQQGSQKTNKLIADAYLVFSKKIGPVRSSVGAMQGNFAESIASLTEFLGPEHLLFQGHTNQIATSHTAFFISAFGNPHPSYPLGVEFIKPNGMVNNPWLLNFKLGYFLHLNFDIAFLKFRGGWDLLGNFAFRTNYFPRR
ncbi:MAG: hypothetical protein HY078_12430 [Elusimicrobia bacterium]|nr:hypothetical protein [Elusimicrobiota bacterium]